MKKIFLTLYITGLIAFPVLAQYVAQDPTRYVPNARILALGKAYIGLADDVGSIYTNPAGMATISGWQLNSMQGSFLGEYNYLSFSGLYPTVYGVIGLGFAGTSITGGYSSTIEANSDPDDPIYTIDYSQALMGNNNNAFILSYANQINNIRYLDRIPFADRMTLGANIKIFQVSLYGDGIVNGDASGQELDLGLKFFPPQKWMTFGAMAKNVLTSSMGGKLTYASGHEESYPLVIKLGSAFHLLGKEDSLFSFGDQDVKISADFETMPTLNNYPMLGHFGAEWKPIPLIALRLGIDQDAAGDGAGGLTTVSDLAYGVGLNYGGFKFDYAYHTAAGIPELENHFFSLGYAFEPPVAVKYPEAPVTVYSPEDKLITFDEVLAVTGEVIDSRVRSLTMNGAPVRFTLKGEFATTAKVSIGKNALLFEGVDEKNKTVGDLKVRVLRLQPFPDVLEGYWVRKPISILAMSRIITGYPDGTFRPEGNITRAEICSLLMKTRAMAEELTTAEAVSESAGSIVGFTDVPAKHWAASYIKQAANLGVVKGYPDGTFKPGGNITRAEGLTMIARFAGISQEAYTGQFRDVATAHWAAPIISGAYNAGILEYLKKKNFEPGRQLTRAETVEMLQRTEYVKRMLGRGLLDWESY